MTVSALVIGSRGLLGASMARAIRLRGATLRRASVRWESAESALDDLTRATDEWLADGAEQYWLVWCAGVGVVSTPAEQLEAEVALFRRFVGLLSMRLPVATGTVHVFLSSSAGGVYAGTPSPPHDENAPTNSTSPYGLAKIAMEDAVSRLADGRTSVLIGRISNLYGPLQSFAKQQGFISHLMRAMLTRRPMSVYVSLDTLRDYIHADDAAAIIAEWLATTPPGRRVVKNIGSLTPVSIAQLIHEARLLFHRNPLVSIAASPYSAGQVRDLRLASVVRRDLDDRAKRGIGEGMNEIKAALELALRQPEERA